MPQTSFFCTLIVSPQTLTWNKHLLPHIPDAIEKNYYLPHTFDVNGKMLTFQYDDAEKYILFF